MGHYNQSGFWAKCGLAAALIVSAGWTGLAGPVASASASGTEETVRAATVAVTGEDRVKEQLELAPGGTVELAAAEVLKAGASTVWLLTVKISNGSGGDILLEDYAFRVKTASGGSLKASLMPEDQNALTVLSGETAVYRFYGTGPEAVAAGDLRLEVSRWDFDAEGYEVSIGTLSGAAAAGGSAGGTLDAGGSELTASAEAVVQRSTGDHTEAAVTLKLHHSGGSTLRLPEWQLWLEMTDGSRHTVAANGLKPGSPVPPGTELTAALTLSVPSGRSLDGAKLVFTRPAPAAGGAGSGTGTGSTVQVPAGWVKLATGSLAAGGAASSRSVELNDGAYTLTLESLQRWPWEDTDLLTAAVAVSHGMDKAMPLPELNGIFRTGGSAEWKAQVIHPDFNRVLQPGQKAMLYMQIKLSPDETAADWELVLQESIRQDGGEFKADRAVWEGIAVTAVPQIASGQANRLSCSAGQWSCTVAGMNLYESREGSLVAIRVDAVNLDKRYTAPSQWVAQLVAEDGTVYPARVEAPDRKVVPMGKAALSVWAPLPYGVETEGMKLLMGQAVTGGKLSGPEDKPDSFLRAALYGVPELLQETDEKLDDIGLFPYTLKITDMHHPFWYYSEFTFEFDYELRKDLTVVSVTKDRRVILQVVDADGREIHEEAYALDSPSGQSLKTGSETVKWKKSIPNITVNIGSYTLRVYEEFRPGYRRLLAEGRIG